VDIGEWETWHRIFEGMTALGTVGATITALAFGIRSGAQERAHRQAELETVALLDLAELAAEWDRGGDNLGLQRRARARLLRLPKTKATIMRAALDDVSASDEPTLRRRLAVPENQPLSASLFTPDAMLAEISANLAEL
jgi:hypothetical protein